MDNKSFIATIAILLLLISLLAEIQVGKVAEADPFFIYKTVNPVPGTIPPIITILSPQNNTIYSPNEVIVSFNVSKPQLAAWDSSIIGVEYTSDNDTIQIFSIWKDGSASSASAIPEFNTTFALPSLPIGNHSLTVKADGVVLKADVLEIFYMNSSSTTFFTVGTPPTPQPSPALASLNYYGDAQQTELMLLGTLALTLGLGSLAYFYFEKGEKGKSKLEK
jgi:hypothetical protein